MDVHGNDNTPEWGYCTIEGCREEAIPIWESGEYPDAPQLLLCYTHIGHLIAQLRDKLISVDYGHAGANRENAALRARLDSVMHAGDMEHARMAALIGAATTMLNQLAVLRYPDESSLWRLGGGALETAYQDLKRAAAAARPQADALLALLADLSRQVGEQNTTIGYQDAMLTEMRTTLDAAYHGLMSYACGNSAPDLAEEMAAHIQATIEKVSKE